MKQNKDTSHKYKFREILILVLGLIFVFVLSEAVYTYKNTPESFAIPNILASRHYATKGKTNEAIKSLLKGAKVINYFKSRQYPGVVPFPDEELTQIAEFKSDSEKDNILSQVKLADLLNSRDRNMGKIFYELAIDSLKKGDRDDFLFFLKAARTVNPELSSFHVEIANFYLTNREMSKLTESLDYCIKFNYPKVHCYSYKASNVDFDAPEPLGFLSEEVRRHYSD